jgi:YVTN family beta-propeller protein
MVNTISKNIYYVSNLGTDMVSIIDGDNLSVIEEIKVGSRPHDIVVDNKNNVYIATDRSGIITIINYITKINKNLYIPNNGNIKVDSISQKIYVSNTEEVLIYNLSDGDMYGRITGFIAVDGIELNNEGSKLFVLDIFQNEVSVYDTLTLKLYKKYKDIGNTPNYIFIGNNDRYIYISNKGISRGKFLGNISVIDIETGNISYIDFQMGSIITALDGYLDYLYAINSGLSRIEIINIKKGESVGSIKTTYDDPQRIKISPDKKFLLVTCKNNKGRGALDIINIEKQEISQTFFFNDSGISPYDIGVVINNTNKNEDIIFKNIEDKWKEDYETLILAKKVISTYNEKIIFHKVSIQLDFRDEIEIEEIVFENCKIIEESKEIIINRDNYLIYKFEFYIPYFLRCKNLKAEKLNIKGNLRGNQKATLYLSNYHELENLEFVVKSSSELMNTPYISDDLIIFDVSSVISTYIIKEELIFIPSKEANKN